MSLTDTSEEVEFNVDINPKYNESRSLLEEYIGAEVAVVYKEPTTKWTFGWKRIRKEEPYYTQDRQLGVKWYYKLTLDSDDPTYKDEEYIRVPLSPLEKLEFLNEINK